MTSWRNWAGNQRAHRLSSYGPVRSTVDVQRVIAEAQRSGRRVKVVGSGDSFTGIARPEQIIVDLEQHAGIINLDAERQTVTVRAGTTIADLNELLAERGYAMPNLGDVT